jgi:hypothetical protein
MKSRIKKIFLVFIGIFFIGFISYKITMRSQNEKLNYEKYGINFNPKRVEIGLKEISDKWESDYLIDENYLNDNPSSQLKFKEVFTFSDIKNGIVYEKDSTDKKSTFRSKIIWLNSNILFWKNGIESEMDTYEKYIDSVTTENLSIRYYFRDDNGNKDYFEADYYQINENEFGFCGTPAVMEREEQRISGKPYFGNITKKQADSILTKWNKKTRHNTVYN